MMKLLQEDFKKCIEFHGHLCRGLVMGYKATKVAMKWLEEHRSVDEEVVAIVENDACFVDAVQVLSGCTFGKGNLIFCDFGKMAVTFLSRNTNKGVRISVKADTAPSNSEHLELLIKIREDKATGEERMRFHELHEERSFRLLDMSSKDLFNIKEVHISIPPKARLEPSVTCYACGEPTMQTKTMKIGSQYLCRLCAARERGESGYPWYELRE